MYKKMKDRGIDMSWYEKHKRISYSVPPDDEVCSNNSIYLLDLNGSLWTVTSQGEPYKQVSEGIKEQPKTIYICACCKQQWASALDKAGNITHL